MKIVFWSCIPGHGNVSSSMIAIASMCALGHRMNSCILQTQFRCNNLQYPFFKLKDKENVSQYSGVGMDSLLRIVQGGGTNGEVISAVRDCGFQFMNRRLTVYTQSTANNERAYRHNLMQLLPTALTDLDLAFDLVFVDTTSGNDPISIASLTEADLIVVCLPQAFWLDNFFFSKYQFKGKKLFYLFTDYDVCDVCNLSKLRRQFKELSKENSAYVSHCVDYSSAMNTSILAQYFMKNYDCTDRNPSYEFMSSLRDASAKMLQFAGVKMAK